MMSGVAGMGVGAGGDQPGAGVGARVKDGGRVVRHVAHRDPSPPPPPSLYHHSAPSGQHHARRLPRVTSPAMSMSQPPLLPPLPQQQHYDAAHLQHLQGQAQPPPPYAAPPPMTAPPMQQQHHPPYQPQQQQHAFAYQNGAMPQAPPMPSTMVVNGNGTMRYALPPQMTPGNMGARTASAKQIKRRTKTGCLTCRKRRIKVRRSSLQSLRQH